jgi:CubicO group peptidase (beta-lactamase class C family)
MRKRALLKGVVLLVGLTGLVIALKSSQASSHIDTPKPLGQTEPAARIERVENGLLPPAVLKGEALVRMTLADRMKVFRTSGVSIAVINQGEVEWARGYGVLEVGSKTRVNADTLFQAASISKPMTALAVLHLVEKKKLQLDEPVNKYLRSWKLPESEFVSPQGPTLRQVLTHSAGLSVSGFLGYGAGQQLPTLIQILNGEKPANSAPIRMTSAPSPKFNYSGGGYLILQQLIEDVTKQSFAEFMDRTILSKLGMKNSTFLQPLPQSLTANAAAGHLPDGKKMDGKGYVLPELAAAGLWTTPTDIARFVIELQKSRVGKSNKVISQSMTQQMLTAKFENVGLGLFVDGQDASWRFHFGSSNVGFKSSMIGYLNNGQGAVVMTNSENGAQLGSEIFRSISAEYGWYHYRPRERVIVTVNPSIYDLYVGEYEIAPGFILKVTREGDKLMSQATNQSKSELFPESKTQFFVKDADATFTFIKDDKGQVVRVDIQRTTRLFQAKRIR